jgi:hypothetical protein
MPSSPGARELARLRAAYRLNELCHRLNREPAAVEALRVDPARALRDGGLDEETKRELLDGDVAALLRRGAHPVLLVRLAVHGLFGLDEPTYSERIRRLGNDGHGGVA